MRNRILLLGPKADRKNPTLTGGLSVLFEDLLSQCKKNSIDYEVIDTNKSNYTFKWISHLSILFYTLVKVPKSTHISLHGSANDFFWIAPIVVFWAKLLNKHMSLRKFAGNFDEVYKNSSKFKKRIIDYILRKSDVNFFETKYLIEFFKKYNDHTYWFPNVRQKPSFVKEGGFKKMFIFIGQVKREKGIMELLDVSNKLDKTYTIDIFGPLDKNMKNVNFENYKANYKGALNSNEVLKTLVDYDVFVLPTFWSGEGYPGVLIEAFSVGIPAIATNLAGIKEMIDQKYSTILIDPKNEIQLYEAIKSVNSSNYDNKVEAALKQFENFNSDHQINNFFQRINYDVKS